ncbi:DUF4920 domain-containing protein [Sphingobacterium griseoflavum]|uniref:Amino acid aminotransferase n=1 Tax=Sphingobacterium griseoflavum TaxID=1474952 RepID=A0ABQ3HTP3_9SPHI|nr:DUF4920 domain-containing protein [Sphingobacterium griseoflavum]GHE23753.1 hypothetical protein GCM10017764_07210 [Sphingobacterium griseoflavum]
MKKIMSMLICTIVALNVGFAQQQIAPAKKGTQYGKKIDAQHAISVADLEKSLQKSENFSGKIMGEVVEVCKKKGCFLTLKRAGGETVMVRFTDYGYFVPADIVGKKIAVEGRAKMKETSVEWLQHYAEDKGASKAEIAKITKPKTDISIVADGVVVLN